ncbi:cytidylyltransferase domain-containing protein [Candidatus Pelagibacter sp.]|uniref:cytidylyltransferase domain-containing protein n=1 Tax=Candidatus Pelagibacter sp. TaxID=2024849 RepID=UPI003F873785
MSSLTIFIPARSGSMRIKNKNLQKLGKISLLDRKIKICKSLKIGNVVVSTNSKKIAKLSIKNGAEIPFLRPEKYSTSKASTVSTILHYLRFLKKNNKIIPTYLAILPLTNPFLKKKTIISAYKKIVKNKKINSIIGFTEANDHPFTFIKVKKKILFNIFKHEGSIYSDYERTQDWPKAYISSAALKITKTSYFLKYLKEHSPLFGIKTFDLKKTMGIKITKKESFDINNKKDLLYANQILNKKN